MRCTLKCSGCYAARYSKKDDIPFEELDRIIAEARDLGVYYIIILGGEPFIINYFTKEVIFFEISEATNDYFNSIFFRHASANVF